ncbi:hypothetical protein ALQ74_200031 [Pseudomonas savastanoi pv. glycinea]|uniref:Uncharacterized protein n=1 Tax=Pseudomonas savastanoi pv. glycinea TaxID=318 RepID=A0A3M3FKX0_PSESG|nr:hypothetical protein ALQ74_200031 [Pseudomonas savastanoi pv. glycinea]
MASTIQRHIEQCSIWAISLTAAFSEAVRRISKSSYGSLTVSVCRYVFGQGKALAAFSRCSIASLIADLGTRPRPSQYLPALLKLSV